jgi:hypothetical protein
MKDYVLNEKPEPASNEMVWAFDLGNPTLKGVLPQRSKNNLLNRRNWKNLSVRI